MDSILLQKQSNVCPISGVDSSIIEGVLIYSCSQTVKQSISKDINNAEHEYMKMGPLNYRSFFAACTDIYLRRISVYDWMTGLFQLSRADYAPVSHTFVCSIFIYIHQKEKIPDLYDKCEPGLKQMEILNRIHVALHNVGMTIEYLNHSKYNL